MNVGEIVMFHHFLFQNLLIQGGNCPKWCFQTYTGNILIAVNPFRKLPHLYDSHMMAQYKGAAFGELSPHPFAVADAAYRYPVVLTRSCSFDMITHFDSENYCLH